MFGVAPRVCRLWHQLSLSSITSLEITVRSVGAAEQLSLWMANHGTNLQHLSLHVQQPIPLRRRMSHMLLLVQSVGAANQLRSLDICLPVETFGPQLDLPLMLLTKLTSLRVKGCGFDAVTFNESIPQLTTLKCLSLKTMFDGMPWPSFLQQISASLVQLTSLDLSHVWYTEATCIAVLHALPQLQQLQLNFAIPACDLSKLGSLPVTAIRVSIPGGHTEAAVRSWLRQSAANLRELSFSRGSSSTHAPPPPLVPLQQALQLRNLSIVGLQPNMSEVAALTQLTRLALDACGLDDIAVCKLSTLSELRALVLSSNDISGAEGSMEVLANSMPHLTSLNLVSTNAWERAEQAFVSRNVVIQEGWRAQGAL